MDGNDDQSAGFTLRRRDRSDARSVSGTDTNSGTNDRYRLKNRRDDSCGRFAISLDDDQDDRIQFGFVFEYSRKHGPLLNELA